MTYSYNDKDDNTSTSSGNTIYSAIVIFIYILFLFWAIILAMKVNDKDHRILHIALAILVSPVYVLSYYLSQTPISLEA